MTPTRDAFLGGRVAAWQPARGFRSGIDAVFLAAACPAKTGQEVLELGCGVGVAALCLHTRVPGVQVVGVERQSDYVALAQENVIGIEALRIVQADLAALPADLRQRQFHHVICNPPYYDPARRSAGADAGREAAHAEETALAEWIRVAARRLRPKGYLTLIQRAHRLADVLAAGAEAGLGSVQIKPVCPRQGREAQLILVQMRKDGAALLRLHSPLVLHQGARHERDGDSYTTEVTQVLRDGAGLDVWD